MYTVSTMKINIRKAREKFSEIINTAAIKKDHVILMSKNKPKAAIVSLEDLKLLEDQPIRKARRLAQLEKIRNIRVRLSKKNVVNNSTLTLKKGRDGRVEQISNSD